MAVFLPGGETSRRPAEVLAQTREANEGRRRIEAKMPVELRYTVTLVKDRGDGCPSLELRKPAASEPLLSSFQVPKLLEAEGSVWTVQSETDDVVRYQQRGW